MRPERRESLIGAKAGGAVIWFISLMALEYIGALVSELLAIILVVAGTYAYTRMTGCSIAGKIGFGMGCVMAAPLLVYYSVIMLISGAKGDISAFLLPALTAGICEELIFRAVPISYIIHGCSGRITDRFRLVLVCVTAALWALAHIANYIGTGEIQLASTNMQNIAAVVHSSATNAATNAATTSATNAQLIIMLLQIISAFGAGILYAAIFIKCGNILPTILIHIAGNLAGYMRIADGMTAQPTEVIIVSITSAALGIMYLLYAKEKKQ